MSDWLSLSGNWDDATKWSGGVPNGSLATARFDLSASSASGTAVISFTDGASRFVNRLEMIGSSATGVLLVGASGTNVETLVMSASAGESATIFATAPVNSVPLGIRADLGLAVALDANTRAIIHGVDTVFQILAPISGSGQLAKEGTGT